MKDTLCLVLGGGRGSRLYPLTKDRCKPAVPFAGKYRLIDIPISNSLNSGFNNIYVLTQFNSESLNKHVTRTYKLDTFSGGFVEIMAAEQSMENTEWFQGTADAVRRCLKHFTNPYIKHVLILSGDQLYKMDFRKLMRFHLEKESQVTIACNPVSAQHTKEFGIMCADKSFRIKKFVEKPQDEQSIADMAVQFKEKPHYLASMGIYLFNKDVLREILSRNKKADFGKEVIPDSFTRYLTHAYLHDGYWKDIGTIKSFYEENLTLTDDLPPVDLFDEQWQFFTRPRHLPPAKITNAHIERSTVAEGSILYNCSVRHSIVGLRSRISDGSSIENTIIMGADYYESIVDLEENQKRKQPSIGIGKYCLLKKAIIDKNVRIGDNVKIINQKNIENFQSESYSIVDGIVVIAKNAVIASGTVI